MLKIPVDIITEHIRVKLEVMDNPPCIPVVLSLFFMCMEELASCQVVAREIVFAAVFNARMYGGKNSKQLQITMSTNSAHRFQIKVIGWLLLYSTSVMVNQVVHVSAEPSRMHYTNSKADTRNEHYDTLEILQRRQHAATGEDDGEFSPVISPSFISIQQSEVATSLGSEMRRLQANAACAANPVCAAAGLAGNC